MRRKTLDLLLNWVGTVLTVVLIVAGVGLVIGNSFTSSQVRSQLQEQKVFFPRLAADYQDLVKAHLTQYAGEEVLTGSEAQIFANDIIGVDTMAISGGKTYAQLSNASSATGNTALANQVELVFRGDTLRACCSTPTLCFMGRSPSSGQSRLSCWPGDALPRAPRIRHYLQIDPEVSI